MKIHRMAPLRALLPTSLCALLISALPLFAQDEAKEAPTIELGAPFGDSAIFQHGKPVPVWGWSKPGTEVSVEFAGQKKSAVAGKDGKWMVALDALKVNTKPAEMKISEKGGKSVTLKDILVGEVWVASGQSNMQWTVGKSAGRYLVEKIQAEVGEGGELPPIREFKVTNYFAHLHPIEHAQGEWADNFSDFSCIAFAFAHKLYQELGVPIGILNCSFSQTAIEAWTPRDGYVGSKSEYNRKVEAKLLETDPSTAEHKEAWNAFYKRIMDAVNQNQRLADEGENEFVALPTGTTPGNMSGNRDATWLFNARLNPVIPYAISGCIWNQGYANMGGGITYYDNLHAMIRGWRKLWDNPELPVYFHQFYSPGNNVNKGPNHPDIGSTAEMRLGTWLARDIPNTGMASQIDVQGAIHYGNKVVPGRRLALHALRNQYGKDVVTDGPMYRDYEIKGDKVVVSFDHAADGLVVADPSYNLDRKNEDATLFADPKVIENGADRVTLFYLCGEDRVWHPATLRIEGSKAIVSSKAVKKPMGVTYGTGGVGFQPSLYNKALLPLTPFIVYDNKLVTSKDWPDSPIRIAGVQQDPSTVGLIYEYRKMPILSTQFRDNAVLQADQPVTIWGSSIHDWGYEAKGEAVIHFSFGDIKKTIPVTKGMTQWKVTLPATKATDKGTTLKVKLTIDGELAHERVAENIIFGDVWYVAGLGDQAIEKMDAQVSGPVRVMCRMAKGVKHKAERKYSVATSTTPLNRFASYWSTPSKDGFAKKLAEAIHQKTGRPVGIIYLDEAGEELKHWMDVASLANAPSLKADYEDIAALTPGTEFYKRNAERYVEAWKKYWGEYIPEMIATKSVPDGAAWGSYPTFGGEVQTDATQVYNCLLASFRRTQLKGIVFMTEQSMVEKNDGADFGGEMSALANGWKRLFKGEKDPHFVYTIPSRDLSAKITKPQGIKGTSSAFEFTEWTKQNMDKKTGKPGSYPTSLHPWADELVEAVIKAAY